MDIALLDKFLNCASAALHFWTNLRRVDIWDEDEYSPGEVDVFEKRLLPFGAPKKIEPLDFTPRGWPRSGPGRRRDLERLGPKWRKRPLVCVKLCIRDVQQPTEADILRIVRIPTNLPLSVVGQESLNEKELRRN
jgi:hypothetical protein